MPHVLVTNDFPPKVGGIQSYLWELWRRLDPASTTVLTTPHEGAAAFDAQQPIRVVRDRDRVLLPHPLLARRIDRLADEVGAGLVVLDPAVYVGQLGPSLRHPYAVVLHGAEVTVPGRLPVARPLLGRVLRGAVHIVAAGGYPAEEAAHAVGGTEHLPPVTVVPPGVDATRFVPLDPAARTAARARLGLPVEGPLLVGQSRLVPRKGFDVVLAAAARLRAGGHPELHVAIGGRGRDRARLEREARRAGVPATFLGRVPEEDLPAVFAVGDVFAMCCRNRWAGLEQEGFGIVFLEAAACAVPQVAGRSGGAHEAVEHGSTGLVVDEPGDPSAVAAAIGALLDDPARAAAMGRAARDRAVTGFSYDALARTLADALATAEAAATDRSAA